MKCEWAGCQKTAVAFEDGYWHCRSDLELHRALRLDEPKIGRPLAPCGTPSAYRRHVRRGEHIDYECRQAKLAEQRTAA